MTAQHPEILIVRRRSSIEDEHHGGAWKIAFADFMTAMMAFFLVLWIISATDKNTKTIIARYFNPVKVEEPAKGQKGIRGAPELDASTPGKESGSAATEKAKDKIEEQATHAPARQAPDAAAPGETKPDHSPERKEPADPARPAPTMSEQELFSDPIASLDKIAGRPPSGPQLDAFPSAAGFGDAPQAADDVIRDPFRPLGGEKPQVLASETRGAAIESGAGKSAERKATPTAAAPETVEPVAAQPEPAEAKTRTSGPPETRVPAPPQPPVEAKDAPAAALDARRQAAARLLADVKAKLGAEADTLPGPQLEVQATDEGILISLTDRQNFSMFAIGSAEPQPRMVRMMDAVAAALKTTPGSIVLRGHTDARPYHSRTYDNWRLSAARAEMACYMLSRAGLPEKRFERIEGFAAHSLKDPAHPLAAENRRIEILLREARQ